MIIKYVVILRCLLLIIFIISHIDDCSSIPTPNVTVDDEIDANDNEIDSEYRLKYAQQMLTFMNQSIDPCDDFYEYSCGNWKNVIDERQDQHKRNNLLDIVYKLGDVVETLLQSPNGYSKKSVYADELKLAQLFYQSCLTAQLLPLPKSQVYLEVIKSIGGFPAVDETWKADNFSWFNMSSHLTNYGVASLIREEVQPEYPFPPYFKLPELGFDSIVHSDNIAANTTHAYEINAKRMREYLTTYGVDETKIDDIIFDIFEFWRAASNISDKYDEDEYQCENLSEMLNLSIIPEFENNYLDIAWQGKNLSSAIEWPCSFYYSELDKLCKERKEAVANYLALKFLYHLDARLGEKKFQRDYCVITIQFSLPYLIDQLYLEEHFHQEIREEITLIVKEIRKSLRDILEHADWLDEITRKEALSKESTINILIGYLEDKEMTKRLIGEMKNLTYVEDNYEQNNINLKKFRQYMKRYNGMHYDELAESTKPLELLVAMQVNAFYYNIDNSIYVMAGILHPPAYHKAWPNAMKFGTIGYLVGHEFTHGFDTVGARYDAEGNAHYWWSKKSGKIFDERANCYVKSYNNYKIPEINRHINGNITKDENIADSGGLREALTAYRRYMKDLTKLSGHTSIEYVTSINKRDEQMPGLDLSPEQLFFLGFAQLWCASYKEEHYWEELSNDHTIDKYRVLGAVTNMEDFAKVYNCPLGSKMNPEIDRCRVW